MSDYITKFDNIANIPIIFFAIPVLIILWIVLITLVLIGISKFIDYLRARAFLRWLKKNN